MQAGLSEPNRTEKKKKKSWLEHQTATFPSNKWPDVQGWSNLVEKKKKKKGWQHFCSINEWNGDVAVLGGIYQRSDRGCEETPDATSLYHPPALVIRGRISAGWRSVYSGKGEPGRDGFLSLNPVESHRTSTSPGSSDCTRTRSILAVIKISHLAAS